MTIYTEYYNKSKKLGEKFGWSQEEILSYAEEKAQDKLAQMMTDLVNEFNSTQNEFAIKGFLLGLNKSHRYLQSEFWSGMVQMMELYVNQDETMFFDGHNIHCKDMIKRMLEAI